MYTRNDWVTAFLYALDNRYPHPYIKHWTLVWTQYETGGPPGALNNLLNTTEKGYGSDLLPAFNTKEDGSPLVLQYPTFEDGIAANVAVLVGGPNFYYPTILDCLRYNHGQPLIDATPDIVKELDTWGTHHAADIARDVALNNIRAYEQFPGRHVGHPN